VADTEASEHPPAQEPTVGSEIERLFPGGLVFDEATLEFVRKWHEPPIFPTDVFAAAGYLLEASGAYQYIVAPFAKGARMSPHIYRGPTLAPSLAELNRWIETGRRWALDWEVVDNEIAAHWTALWSHRDDRLVVTPGKKQPIWWKHAHALLVIADEASSGLGYTLPGPDEDNEDGPNLPWANFLSARLLNDEAKRRMLAPASTTAKTGEHLSRHVARDSLAQLASRDVVRVLPKGRTASLGCTFRTLTHNLALLPPHGRSSAYWHQPRLFEEANAKPEKKLNLLLVPFPFQIAEHCFVGETSTADNGDGPWGRFSIDQKWLAKDGITNKPAIERARERRSLIEFVDRLIVEAEKDGTEVHGLILPELALDWPTYDALARTLLGRRPSIELLMSGVSSDCNGNAGNLVTTSLFHSVGDTRFVETHSRMKHHRWCIEDTQIEAYGIDRELDPKFLWWEYLQVGERVLNIDVIRQSTMTAVICEDLARVDPGLATLRLLGPNLVVALLMDGPQLKSRWPGRYATALAEDPGSSVLTLTSYGLVRRSNTYSTYAPSTSVALWRNYPRRGIAPKVEPAAELTLDAKSQGLLLTLRSEQAIEATSDGRPNSDAIAWIYGGLKQVGIERQAVLQNGWDWIVPDYLM
jgi:hypothetical protein